MANFGNIVNWVLRLEDRTLAGKTVDLKDGAGFTRFGLTSKNFGSMLPANYFNDYYGLQRMSNDEAIQEADSIYWQEFWVPMRCTDIASDAIASELMSFGVNESVSTVVKMVQWLLSLPQDGVMGRQTLSALQAQDPNKASIAIREAQETRYQNLVKSNPANQRFLRGWENRAGAIFPDLP